MKIYGLQKMTLLDFPGKVACTVFLNGCDFRCPFCHNYGLAIGAEQPVMEEEELLRFLEKRKGLLDGVAFTGGEPCLHNDLPRLIARIKAMGYAVKLDTNGYHPKMLEKVLPEVDYVAMDIKNSPEKYAVSCGVERLDMSVIEESIQLLKERVAPFEFRTTVVKELHCAKDFEKIGPMIEGSENYYLQGFVDRVSVPFGNLHAPEKEDLLRYAEIVRPYVKNIQIRGVE